MSYTNQTQHYGLPQYVGTDVPAYLTDYNGAMATIDQGMNAAKTQADAAATAAGQAANDVTALNSTVNTQATQISAAAQAASNAQTTANSADGKADALDVRVTALEQTPAVITPVDVSAHVHVNSGNVLGAYKYGNIIILTIENATLATGYGILATLDAEIVPKFTTTCSHSFAGTANFRQNAGASTVQTNGTVYLDSGSSGQKTAILLTAIYLTD